MNDFSEILSRRDIDRHHLQGFTYSEQKDPFFYQDWKRQVVKNHLIFEELQSLEPLFEKVQIPIVLLKGFALLGDLYEDWGARFASDVDLLVPKELLQKTKVLLQNCGFHLRREELWLGNSFKTTFLKQTPLMEITIELHSQLFWNQSVNEYNTRPHQKYRWFRQLNYEDQLVHLCGHLAFQHTFIKLFWLFDIQKYLEKFEDRVDWSQFWLRAGEFKVIESCQLCIWLLRQEKSYPPPATYKQKILRFLCEEKFLLNPRQFPFRYFLIKTLLKDSWRESLDYYLQLFEFKSGRIFRQILSFLDKTDKEKN